MTASEPAGLEAGRLAASLTDAVAGLMRKAAEEVLLPRFRTMRSADCEEKSAGEVVTIADRECEQLLGEGLSKLLPSASVVGEEAVHAEPDLLQRLEDQLCWIVDPLDGTGYFAEGHEPFGIMIALASEGQTVGGWIFDPLSGRLWWAAAGAGCWTDGRQVKLDRPRSARPAIGLSSLLQRRPARFVAVRSALEERYSIADIPRCAAALYPAMLAGTPELTLFERTLPWDHAPGVLMIEEAGGRARRLDGSVYDLCGNRVGLLAAADPRLWAEAAALLQDLPN